jgi:hypothetical protein
MSTSILCPATTKLRATTLLSVLTSNLSTAASGISKRLAILLVGGVTFAAAMNQPAQSSVWDIGGTVAVRGTNAPINFGPTNVSLTLGTIGIPGTNLELTSSLVDAGGARNG